MIRGYVNYGWDSLRGSEESEADKELREAIAQPSPTVATPTHRVPEPPITIDLARRLFDLQPNATSRQIQEAYDKLKSAVAPEKFAAGTEAYERSKQLLRRLDSAKQVLLDNMDPTVRRFEGLEIE